MTPPPVKTMALGHPIIAVPLCCLGLWFVYQWYLAQTMEAGALAIGCGILANRALRANEQRTKYLAWRRAWNAMEGENRQARRDWRTPAKGLILGCLPLLLLWFAAHASREEAVMASAIGAAMVPVSVIAITVILIRRRSRKGKAAAKRKWVTVKLAVSRPVLPVPSLARAYAALPPHCQALLKGQRQGR